MRNRYRAWLLAWLLIVLSAGSILAGGVESYRYRQTVGDKRSDIHWCVLKGTVSRLIYREESGETHVTVTDGILATTEWHFMDPHADTAVLARREGNRVLLTGRHEGEVLDREVQVDKNPWIQATSWSMRRFIASGEASLVFWTFHPDTLKAYTVSAARAGEGVVEVSGQPERAVQLELQLTGWRAPFWKARYWFREKDGLFLRFEGPSGPPGAPPIVVAYQGAADPLTEAEALRLIQRIHTRADSQAALQGG